MGFGIRLSTLGRNDPTALSVGSIGRLDSRPVAIEVPTSYITLEYNDPLIGAGISEEIDVGTAYIRLHPYTPKFSDIDVVVESALADITRGDPNELRCRVNLPEANVNISSYDVLFILQIGSSNPKFCNGTERESTSRKYFPQGANIVEVVTLPLSTTDLVDADYIVSALVTINYADGSSRLESSDIPGFFSVTGKNFSTRGTIAREPIRLVENLPDNFQGTDVERLLGVYEDVINTMYVMPAPQYSEVDPIMPPGQVATEADLWKAETPMGWHPVPVSDPRVAPKVDRTVGWVDDQSEIIQDILHPTRAGIIDRMREMYSFRDPFSVPTRFIADFAAEIGYDINMGFNSTTAGIESIRSILHYLPHWYKIAGTHDATKIVLYSFGLVADIISLYTNDAGEFEDEAVVLAGVKKNPTKYRSFYPSSHFRVSTKMNSTDSDIFDYRLIPQIIEVIESTKPITEVMAAFSASIQCSLTINEVVGVSTRNLIRIV